MHLDANAVQLLTVVCDLAAQSGGRVLMLQRDLRKRTTLQKGAFRKARDLLEEAGLIQLQPTWLDKDKYQVGVAVIPTVAAAKPRPASAVPGASDTVVARPEELR